MRPGKNGDISALLEHIGSILPSAIHNATPLAGGDINNVLLLQTSNGPYVLKWNDHPNLFDMFEKEALGLRLLAQSDSFRIPEVIVSETWNNISFLLLEYIPSGKATAQSWQSFALSLVTLHSKSQSVFGLDHDNYIGSLVQSNGRCKSAAEFFITQRLEPQFASARAKGFVFKSLDQLYKNAASLIPEEPSSLIHGDLWNGNYLISDIGQPVLIDPAVAFAPREMDLAMMQLFGGFPSEVFALYNEEFPLETAWESRTSLWQLYYVLVHVTIFGGSYVAQAKEIVSRYS